LRIVAIREMYPQIPLEVVTEPLESVQHTLGTNTLVDTWQDILYTSSFIVLLHVWDRL